MDANTVLIALCASHVLTAMVFLIVGCRIGRGLAPIQPVEQWPMLRKFLEDKPVAKPDAKPLPRDKF
jgi:hypothetical protein